MQFAVAVTLLAPSGRLKAMFFAAHAGDPNQDCWLGSCLFNSESVAGGRFNHSGLDMWGF